MNEFPVVLVINCSSSSIKFSALNASDCEVLISGIVDGVSSENIFSSVSGEEPAPLAHHNYEGALETTVFELEKRNLNDGVALIDRRIAHGSGTFTESAIITDEVIDSIRRISPLAPPYNYTNLSGIGSVQQLFPGITQVAVSDTGFHQTMASEAYLYGLPWKYYEGLDVRRYGFHDTPHHYVSQHAHSLLDLAGDDSNLVVAHLDNGASICAVRNGQGVDTSMGMAPLEGSMMGTRGGDIDFGVISWAANQTNQSLEDLERVVNKEPGLLGISDLSSDLRVLEKAWHEGYERTQLAVKTFAHRIARHIAEYAASLHRLDGIVFTSEIRENSSLICRLVMEHLATLGVETDTEMNNRSSSFGERIVSSENARVTCAVIPINEEKMIVLDAIHLGKVNAPAELT